MSPLEKITATQKQLVEQNLDGWLLYDFRKTNDLACRFLEIPADQMVTRRFFYWIPKEGYPIKIVHRIEQNALASMPGEIIAYSSWQELESLLKKVLMKTKKIAMEYSPRNAIPYVSKVDGGTLELVRSFGVDVVSSADLLQTYTSVWTSAQLESHLAAAQVLDETVAKAWQLIATALKQKKILTELDVQQFILSEFKTHECHCDDPPICAVNAHAADPHYMPSAKNNTIIQPGDFILIDLWCKQKKPHAVYADITRVGVAAKEPAERQNEIFSIVKRARDAAMHFLEECLHLNRPIQGWEVDKVCRDVIENAGYGQYFTHRTGHNIGERDHGDGANIDNLETQDTRRLLPGTCFSIEPGIYLPEEFGVRLEHDVYLELDGKHLRATGGVQQEIVCLL